MADLQTQETGKDTWEHDIPRLQARGKNGRTDWFMERNEQENICREDCSSHRQAFAF